MEFGGDITDLAFMFTVAIAVGGMAVAILFPFFSSNVIAKRVDQVSVGKKDAKANSFRSRFAEDKSDTRRRQIQDTLKQLENEEKKRKKKITLRVLIEQAGSTSQSNCSGYFR